MCSHVFSVAILTIHLEKIFSLPFLRPMKYFAYGSNMLLARLQKRTPTARTIGTALLLDHSLQWHKAGRDGSAKCDIIEDPGKIVWGVLYEVSHKEKPLLDAAEGLGEGYDEKKVAVHIHTTIVEATAYVATALDASLLPFCWYRDLVYSGAVQNNVPEAYLEEIRHTPTMSDPDKNRSASHELLIRNRQLGSGSIDQ